MSSNYIELYKVDNKLNAKIHKNGKVCTLTNQNSIKKLLDICHKHNMLFKGKRILDGNVDPIIQEFDSYYAKIKRNKKLIMVAENIDKIIENVSLKKNTKMGKIIISTTLAATLGITALGINNNLKKQDLSSYSYENQITVEEIPEYVLDEENLAPIIANQDNNLEIENVVNATPIEEQVEILEETPIETIEENEVIEPQETLNEVIESEATETESEISQMLQSDTFHFSYTDRSNSEEMNNARRYQDLFELYGHRYGVDPNLLMAMAAQENSGQHYENLYSPCAIGIMQLEESVNLNTTVTAYNRETHQNDTVYVTRDSMENLETNIMIGTMILSNRFEQTNYNLVYGIQKYNMGDGNMARSIAMCSDIENISEEELINNRTNPEWLNYREFLGVGDPLYVEHVFSYIPSGTVLRMVNTNGEEITLQVINDNVNNLQLN